MDLNPMLDIEDHIEKSSIVGQVHKAILPPAVNYIDGNILKDEPVRKKSQLVKHQPKYIKNIFDFKHVIDLFESGKQSKISNHTALGKGNKNVSKSNGQIDSGMEVLLDSGASIDTTE